MEIRQKEDTRIRTTQTTIRQVQRGMRITGTAWKGTKYTGKEAVRLAKAGIAEGKDLLRSRDAREQLKMLTPEQKRQWRSYSFRKQTQLLNRAERMAVKEQGRRAASKSQPSARMLAHQLNRLAKGNTISNRAGMPEKWEMEVPKGDTAAEIRKSLKSGDMETVSWYTGNISKGRRKVKHYQNKLKKAIKREKRENRRSFEKVFVASLEKDMRKSKQIQQMQRDSHISQMQIEQMDAMQVLKTSALPIRLRVNYAVQKLEKRLAKAVSAAFAKYVLPALLPLLIILLLLVSIPAMLGGSSESGSGANGGQKLVLMAMSQLGQTGGQPYWSYMGYSSRIPWCASFVSWCANECGYIESGIIPKSGNCNGFRDFYKGENLWYNGKAHGGDYYPKSGDLILFHWSSNTNADLEHVGIVKNCDGTRVNTIEGNCSDMVKECSYSLDDSRIIGYASPEYPATDLAGGSNAEKIFNYLMENGFSKAAASAVVGNLYAEGGQTADGDINIHSTEDGGSGEGVGMVQWSFGRKDAFLAYCEQRGQPWPNAGLEIQIDFMLQEFFGGQWMWSSIGAEYGSQCNITKEAFMRLDDVDLATRAWCAKFERCHYIHSHLEDVRIPKARAMYDSH